MKDAAVEHDKASNGTMSTGRGSIACVDTYYHKEPIHQLDTPLELDPQDAFDCHNRHFVSYMNSKMDYQFPGCIGRKKKPKIPSIRMRRYIVNHLETLKRMEARLPQAVDPRAPMMPVKPLTIQKLLRYSSVAVELMANTNLM